ncbi:hypothetical protein FHT82_005441 [Rhizobium sp. BK275]|uniref:hypothetical protein n=1 Tax=Rhizobium sp. BK275 TaxID=2587077 RepID=UPI00160F1D8D|nr:hypothetical protein [Rhizobium sp. BK275]
MPVVAAVPGVGISCPVVVVHMLVPDTRIAPSEVSPAKIATTKVSTAEIAAAKTVATKAATSEAAATVDEKCGRSAGPTKACRAKVCSDFAITTCVKQRPKAWQADLKDRNNTP